MVLTMTKGVIRTHEGTPEITLKKGALIHTEGMRNVEGVF